MAGRYATSLARVTAAMCLWLLPASVVVPASDIAAVGARLDVSIVFVQEPLLPNAHELRPYVGAAVPGSRIVALGPDGGLVMLTEAFASAADPCVSYDGTRLLFAGKMLEDEPWDIWEMPVAGGSATRVTQGLGDCREPVYLPLAAVDSPGFSHKVRWVSFISTAPGVLNDQADGPLTSLYAMSLTEVLGRGTVLWRTSHNLGGDIGPTVLQSDGRVLFSGRQRGAFGLMAISWSGENLNAFYGSHTGGTSQIAACELPDRTVAFIEAEEGETDGGGRLARVHLRRPLHSRELLDEGTGRYRTPHALPDGRLLVSLSQGGSTFGIYTFRPGQEQKGDLVYDDPEWHEVDAMPVVRRAEPPGRIPTVGFASVLDVGALKTVGQLQCLNVYETDRPWPGIERAGQVTGVRLVEGVPYPLGDPPATDAAPDSTWPPRGVRTRVLGEAPVEADGSFYVNVAGDVPFYVQLLDDTGRAVQSMRAWTWVRAGDQRGCIGCHEDKEMAPENRATDALVRARPRLLAPPPEQRRSYTFEGEVVPILRRRCESCHGTARPVFSGDPRDGHRGAYASLLGLDPASEAVYVLPGNAAASPLAGLLQPGVGDAQAHGNVTDDERRTILAWIDLGARYNGNRPGPVVRAAARMEE